MGMVFCALSKYQAYSILRRVLTRLPGIVGLTTASSSTIDLAYDVLGLEALFLVPRIFSLLSLNPYFGTLVSRCQNIPRV